MVGVERVSRLLGRDGGEAVLGVRRFSLGSEVVPGTRSRG